MLGGRRSVVVGLRGRWFGRGVRCRVPFRASSQSAPIVPGSTAVRYAGAGPAIWSIVPAMSGASTRPTAHVPLSSPITTSSASFARQPTRWRAGSRPCSRKRAARSIAEARRRARPPRGRTPPGAAKARARGRRAPPRAPAASVSRGGRLSGWKRSPAQNDIRAGWEHVFDVVRRTPLPLGLLVPRRSLAARRDRSRRARAGIRGGCLDRSQLGLGLDGVRCGSTGARVASDPRRRGRPCRRSSSDVARGERRRLVESVPAS